MRRAPIPDPQVLSPGEAPASKARLHWGGSAQRAATPSMTQLTAQLPVARGTLSAEPVDKSSSKRGGKVCFTALGIVSATLTMWER